MSDHGKPIDTLPTKNASELNLLDTLLGVSTGGEPAAFQTPLGELAESDDFLDALTDGLISRIIGPVESNANGSFVRLENGLQLAWREFTTTTAVNVSSPNSAGGYRSGQQSAPMPAGFFGGVRTMPFVVANPLGVFALSGGNAASVFQWNFYAQEATTVDPGLPIFLAAVGRWK